MSKLKEYLKEKEQLNVFYIGRDEKVLHKLNEIFENVETAKNSIDALVHFSVRVNKVDLIIVEKESLEVDDIEELRELNENVSIFLIFDDIEVFKNLHVTVDTCLYKDLFDEKFENLLLNLLEKIYLQKELISLKNLLNQYVNITNKSTIISKGDIKGNITFANEKFCQISGYSEKDIIGKPHSILRHPEMPKATFKEMWETIKDKKEVWQGVIKNRARNGDTYYVKATIQPILDVNGDIVEYISLRHDITEIMSDKKQLFDYLESNKLAVLILVQIEDYDTLEKFYDHENVEKIEKSFGQNLLYLMPNVWGFQKVYHLEHGLYAFAIDRRTCQAACQEIEKVLIKLLHNIKEYVVKLDEIEYDISAICSYTYGVFNIYEDAKMGIEKAKEEKTDIVYADGLSGLAHENALKNIETLHTIKTAIDEENVISYFQPIVNNKSLKVEKYESLVRIINEDGSMVSPYAFMDVAKKGRYYSKITKAVLHNSFYALNQTDKSISINLSVLDIENEEIKNIIYNYLKTHSSNANRIIFELLESEALKDIDVVQQFVSKVKLLGVQIAIDDFGTGYSNFERILKYKPDIVKIDGSLIRNIDTSSIHRNIVETIVSFAKKLHIKTVAEFVENEDIFNIVKELEIDYSQGYAFGRPEPTV